MFRKVGKLDKKSKRLYNQLTEAQREELAKFYEFVATTKKKKSQ